MNAKSTYYNKLFLTLFTLAAVFFAAVVVRSQDQSPPSVVIAVVESVALNNPNTMGGQNASRTDPIYRLKFKITEVLRGPKELLGQNFFSLSTADMNGLVHYNFIIPNLKIGDEGLFGLYKERDGLWYDIGVGGPFDANDPWLAYPRLLKNRDPKYEKIVNGLRDRRDRLKVHNAAESKNERSATAPQVQSVPLIPQTKPVPAKPAAVAPEKAEQTYLGFWLTGIVAAIAACFLLFRKEK
jgi:hypothetical protein